MRLALVLVLSSIALACEGPGGGGAVVVTCRNGALDPGEICDGTLVGNNSCQSAGYERGVLICNQACTNFDYSGCTGGSGPDVTQPDTSSPSDTSGTTGPEAGAEVTGGNHAPVILSLNSNVSILNLDDGVIITAVVTDPDGIDDLIGGSLVDPGTGRSYGSFATSAAEGSYTITLTWSAIDTVAPLAQAPPNGAQRGFRAEFYDVAGVKASQVLNLTYRCDASNTNWLCDGECAHVQTSTWHCGACGNRVPSGLECVNGVPGCFGSDIVCSGECTAIDEPARCGVCDHSCYDVAEQADASARECAGSAAAGFGCVVNVFGVHLELSNGQTCGSICGDRGLGCYNDGENPPGLVVLDTGELVYLACDASSPHQYSDTRSASCDCYDRDGITNPDPTTTTTITAIQSSTDSVSCGSTGDATIGGEVTFEGVVTVPVFSIDATLKAFFVSDGSSNAYTGMLVRFPSTQTWSFSVGERVRVTGTHHEFFCQTQFAATAIASIGTGNVSGARTIAKNLSSSELEKYEGVVVKISGVSVTTVNEFGDADTDAGVVIDDFILGTSYVVPAAGDTIQTLTGVITWSFSRYRIAPRTQSDL